MIVIGDIHGCYKTLMALIDKLPPDQHICFSGDLVDRGPDSAKVIEFIKNSTHDCVRGNHEDMMLIYHTIKKYKLWLNNGGQATIDSYNGNDDMLKDPINWITNLPFYKEYPEVKDSNGRHLVVSHANITGVWTPGHKDTDYFNDYAMWSRSQPRDPGGIYNIHGHTPKIDGPIIKSFFANVDTGAIFGGVLTALQFPEMIVYKQENVEE